MMELRIEEVEIFFEGCDSSAVIEDPLAERDFAGDERREGESDCEC